MTDARQLVHHLVWAAETKRAHDAAFNVVDGDFSRWQWRWGLIAEWFEIKALPFDGVARPLEQQMANDTPV